MIIKQVIELDELCLLKRCPKIYETDEGTIIIQGNPVKKELKVNLSISNDEEAVEVPISLIEKLIKSM